jgi:hypothetical protein
VSVPRLADTEGAAIRGEMGKLVTIIRITGERAPCGRLVDGERHRDEDDEGLVFDDLQYACGCRQNRHQFHDGSVRSTTIRHDGRVLADEVTAGA